MNLPLVCKNPIILSLLKIVTLRFTLHVLTVFFFAFNEEILHEKLHFKTSRQMCSIKMKGIL